MKSIKIESYPQGALTLLKHCVIGKDTPPPPTPQGGEG
jgi:hypothetical protein